jgi:hypothetical protein
VARRRHVPIVKVRLSEMCPANLRGQDAGSPQFIPASRPSSTGERRFDLDSLTSSCANICANCFSSEDEPELDTSSDEVDEKDYWKSLRNEILSPRRHLGLISVMMDRLLLFVK